MTQAEAIQTLQANAKLLHFEHPYLGIKEAIEVVIEALSQPSLPSDLDEAAEEYRDTEVCTDSDYIDDDGDSLYRSFALREAFKAGAEWMAGRGITVDGTFHHSCGYPSVIELKTYLRDYEGADVIVTIRKK